MFLADLQKVGPQRACKLQIYNCHIDGRSANLTNLVSLLVCDLQFEELICGKVNMFLFVHLILLLTHLSPQQRHNFKEQHNKSLPLKLIENRF
jgi:hypothetical protein